MSREIMSPEEGKRRHTVGDIPQEHTLSRPIGRHDCDEVDGDVRSKLNERERTHSAGL